MSTVTKYPTLTNCYYCELPAAAVEYDHFPIPKRFGGTETVPACLNCHTVKDRIRITQLPAGQLEAAMNELYDPDKGLPIMHVTQWRNGPEEQHIIPYQWERLSPIARIIWARFLTQKLEYLDAGGWPDGYTPPAEYAAVLGIDTTQPFQAHDIDY